MHKGCWTITNILIDWNIWLLHSSDLLSKPNKKPACSNLFSQTSLSIWLTDFKEEEWWYSWSSKHLHVICWHLIETVDKLWNQIFIPASQKAVHLFSYPPIEK